MKLRMDISLLIASLLANGAFVHPQGHLQEGATLGSPMKLNYGNLTETWGKPPKSKEDEIAIHGAGFKAQDDIARAVGNEEMYLANALLKGLQASGITEKLVKNSSDHPENSDIGEMKRISGNKATRAAVGFSALADLYKSQNPKQTWDISAGPMPNSTAVGLTFNKRF